ncbi:MULTISPECIES: imidazole glycerol phosphate synthase subunit HisH [Thermoactinomyces]|jgi:imidazole glycerol-phosphate synthase subunit HisH|uniref:Imidazole glycerol phosphate synthase subunit HisH n=1 Tax=Thermoactinomyces vulgaris TaxID=2026 RepID=A0ABS0QHM1_THEVU|nr:MULTISPECIES: imidazole glycerol phosphate synthase subunit HisH [Thermoactinomyces]KFZ39438.1 imidazole glycerol phosphate synthase [Thermoactinomyces sp. Gus2-1]KYQ86285.1 imidazole glycerol phosphate synthase subunit HisH [Thermoactinomyces sp. AS95]MBA4550949.1 imidazole glycerol phosphate synthase subunit HisH [Thermoactinomyces vulgaris]MBA4597092.1 imidazole glycerol phosphate synthase subunit HisH [Thermoactinomyces vulgaris]MBH8583493.1 imidazole glycerol phosphate synthase subunit
MIVIVDYGMGNLHSVSKALERMGYDSVIASDRETILEADAIILPGVGAFGKAMYELTQRDLAAVIKEAARRNKPVLGICLGMQLLFTSSDEHGYHQGLNLLPGHVVRFEGEYRIPHMGWNWLSFKHPHPLFKGLEEGHVYFAHSYHIQADNPEDVIATTDYHQTVAAVVTRGNIYGMQFHPEKSGKLGLALLERFAKLSEKVGTS